MTSTPDLPRVIMTPDWRAGVPYQTLLCESLQHLGVQVDFLRDYRRVLPLWRGLASFQRSVLHLHWPEAYYPPGGSRRVRALRFAPDLALARRRHKLVVTAHNLLPHNRHDQWTTRLASRSAYRQADAVVCHSSAAAERIGKTFGLPDDRLHVIPHGDLLPAYPTPPARAHARAECGLSERPACLVFGAIEPYKGLEGLIDAWKRLSPSADLVIVGKPISADYAETLFALIGGDSRIRLHAQWLGEEELMRWLAACDATIFNYHDTLTSGAACLARSMGLPVILPARLATIELMEPHPLVFRFEDTLDDNFAGIVAKTLQVRPDFDAAAEWRAATSWENVAARHLEIYRLVAARPII